MGPGQVWRVLSRVPSLPSQADRWVRRYMLCYGTESVAVAVFELLPDDAVMVMV